MAQAVNRHEVRLIGVARRETPLPYGARMEMLVADPQNQDKQAAKQRSTTANGSRKRKPARTVAAPTPQKTRKTASRQRQEVPPRKRV